MKVLLLAALAAAWVGGYLQGYATGERHGVDSSP